MDVFLTWSGSRSKATAEALCGWLPDVIQTLAPWMSVNIAAGARWSNEIADRLQNSKFGIACVTRDNLDAPWLHFEAGALAKALTERARFCPYLIELNPEDIPGDNPLAQFQAKRADVVGTWDVLKALNDALDQGRVDETRLKRTFDRCWSGLQEQLSQIPAGEEPELAQIKPETALGEILVTVRDLRARSDDDKPTRGLLNTILNIRQNEELRKALRTEATRMAAHEGIRKGLQFAVSKGIDEARLELDRIGPTVFGGRAGVEPSPGAISEIDRAGG